MIVVFFFFVFHTNPLWNGVCIMFYCIPDESHSPKFIGVDPGYRLFNLFGSCHSTVTEHLPSSAFCVRTWVRVHRIPPMKDARSTRIKPSRLNWVDSKVNIKRPQEINRTTRIRNGFWIKKGEKTTTRSSFKLKLHRKQKKKESRGWRIKEEQNKAQTRGESRREVMTAHVMKPPSSYTKTPLCSVTGSDTIPQWELKRLKALWLTIVIWC